jgi:hypothetical protein
MGRLLNYKVHDFDKAYIPHPDENVDLAAIPISAILQQVREKGEAVFMRSISFSDVADEDLLSQITALEDVIMVGYPNALRDTVNNLPIVRKGITATSPRHQFNGRPEFLIDCACFAGSSGSPIFLKRSIGSVGAKAGHRHELNQFTLIGILWGGPQFNAVGEVVVVPVPTDLSDVRASLRIPMNLGYCVRSTELKWFYEYFAKRSAGEMSPQASSSMSQ